MKDQKNDLEIESYFDTKKENDDTQKSAENSKLDIYFSGEFESQEERRLLNNRIRALKLKKRLDEFDLRDHEYAKKYVQECTRRLKREWPALFGGIPERIFVHIDLDAFYCSVETLNNPQYRDIPIAVGGNMMICTANYAARKFGIRAGMPGSKAKQICPELVIVRPQMKKYEYYSGIIMNLLSTYDNEIEIGSIDEATLSFTEEKFQKAIRKFNNTSIMNFHDFNFEGISFLVELIRKQIKDETGLTVSAGISVCRGLSKMACSVNKPNGQFLLKEKFTEFLRSMPIEKINGIGKQTKETLLKTLKIRTISDLIDKRHLLFLTFRTKTFNYLFRLSFGLKACESSFIHRPSKGIGCGTTITPTNSLQILTETVWNLSSSLWVKMCKYQLGGFVYILKLKYSDFSGLSRQIKIKELKDTPIQIFDVFMAILKEMVDDRAIRRIGLRLCSLISLSETHLLEKYSAGKIKEKFNCKYCCKSFNNNHQYLLHRYGCDQTRKKERTGIFKYINRL